ncbi:MAG: TonB-dependent receptor [Stagnimonas sp.]|nr:TonB-dependent receptor [Stagnimonas sp.]
MNRLPPSRSSAPSSRRLAGAALLLSLSALAQAQSGEPAAPVVETIPVDSLPETAAAPAKTEAQPPSVRLDAVEVTGSRIKRTDLETSQPVVRLSRKDLDRTGSVSVGDILQGLPAAGAALNTTFNNGGTGATEVDLRNLGSNRVLVLVDGHRWISGLRSLSTNSVDLNTIPYDIVERIEVLQDGASAAYGSDAITGVVNIITRKKLQGLTLSAQYGMFDQRDGEDGIASLTGGHVFDGLFGGNSTSIAGSFSVRDQRPVFAGDRELSRLPLNGTGLTRGSSFTPEGRFLFVGSPQTNAAFGSEKCPSLAGDVAQPVLDDNGVPLTLPTQLGMLPQGVNLCDITHVTGAPTGGAANYRAFDPASDPYNYALTNYLTTPLRTYNGFLSLQHEFLDNLRFSAQGLYSLRQSKQQLAPQPIAFGDIAPVIGGLMPGSSLSYNQATYITPGHSFNPTAIGGQPGQYIGYIIEPEDPTAPGAPAAGLLYTGAVLRRMSEGDPRIQEQNVPTRFVRAGFDGDFSLLSQRFDWELGYSYGVSSESQNLLNNYRMDRIQQAVVGNRGANDENPYNVPLCEAPCVPINFFGGPGTITREMLDYISIDEHSNTRHSQSDIYLNISTSIAVPLLPDVVGLAVGVERRADIYSDNPSIYQINGTTSGLTAQPTSGSVAAKELFVELDVPVLKDQPLFQELGFSLAGRSSDYGDFGKTTNGKIGGRWKPVDDLLLRSSFSTSFRAPNVGELFLSNAGSYPGLEDPCAAPEAGSVTATNCNADGVAAYTQTVQQFYSPFTGNRDLNPETSHSLTAGIVLNPRFAPGFDLSVDYFRIKIDNYITPPGAQLILDQCYTTTGRAYCDFVTRQGANNNGPLQSVLNAFQNFPSIETSGIDFNVNYLLPASQALGKFKIAANATFLSSYKQQVQGSEGPEVDDSLHAGVLTLPRWKINPSLQWAKAAYSASLNTRIIWGSTETCEDGIPPSLSSLGLCSDPDHRDRFGNPDPKNRVGYAWKSDLQLGYNAKALKTQFTLGVQNLFDQDPPVSYSAFANSFDPSYWVPGQFLYAGLKHDF